MKKTIATEVKVGVFVLVTLAILMGMIFALSSSRQLFKETYVIYAAFTNVQGLIVGAPVHLAGVTVGRVAEVDFVPEFGEKNVRVRLEMDKDIMERVRKDSMVSIQTVGLLGDKYLELAPGTPAFPALAPLDYVAVREPTDLYAALEKGNLILDNTVKITNSLNEILGGAAQGGVGKDFQRTLHSVQAILSEVEKGQGLLHSLIYGARGEDTAKLSGMLGSVQEAADSFTRLSKRLDRLVGQVEKGSGVLHELIYSPQADSRSDLRQAVYSIQKAGDAVTALSKDVAAITSEISQGQGLLHELIYQPNKVRLSELNQVASSTKRAADSFALLGGELREMVADVKKGDGLLHKVIYDRKAAEITDSIADLTALLEKALKDIKEGKGLLPALLFDPDTRETLEEWRVVAANLSKVTTKLEQGEGSLGGLIQDPSVYEDIKTILSGAKRSGLIKFLIRFVGDEDVDMDG